MPHAFPFQFFLLDEAVIVAMPQPLVVIKVLLVESFEVRRYFLGQLVADEQFVEGFFGVGFKVPQGVVEVEEEMGVRHVAAVF